MKLNKVLGFTLLAAAFLGVFAAQAYTAGWPSAVFTTLSAFAFAAFILAAIALAND